MDPFITHRRPRCAASGFEACELRLVLAHPSIEMQVAALTDQGHLNGSSIVDSTPLPDRARLGLTGFGQTVAIIDSGIAYDHEALGGGFGPEYRVVGGWDFTDENDANPYDDAPAGFHGTHVAGIIGSSDRTHPGLAPEVDLVSLRVFDDQGVGSFEWIEQALQWVSRNIDTFEHPITTVNLSLGTKWKGTDVPTWAKLENEFADLHQQGVFVTVAAGNGFEAQQTMGLNYPATSPHVIPVASHGADHEISEFSQRSRRVLVAPGENVTSTVPDFVSDFNGHTDDFLALSGTSMAAPFIAGAAVLVRQAMELTGRVTVGADAIYSVLRDTARQFYDSATGNQFAHVDLDAAIRSILPQSEVVNLGRVLMQDVRIDDLAPVRYELTASNTGILTFQPLAERDARHEVQIRVYNANRQLVTGNAIRPMAGRVDIRAVAGETFFVDVTSNRRNMIIRLANVVSTEQDAIHVYGTVDDDEFIVNGPTFSVNGIQYDLDQYGASALNIDGAGGNDSLRVNLTSHNNSAWIRPGQLRLEAPDLTLDVNGIEKKFLYSMGQNDAAYLYGSAGNDTFTGLPSYSVLQGPNYYNYVEGFSSVRAVAQRSGIDTATLYDSPLDDTYYGLPEYSVLAAPEYRIHVQGFGRVDAHAVNGGEDIARLYDSPGDDRLYALPEYVVMESDAHRNYVRGFDAVRAYANRGGADHARLFDSTRDDVFYGLPSYAALKGQDVDNYAEGFEQVRAYSRHGSDLARLYGSLGNDQYHGLPEYAVITGDSFHHYVEGFKDVRAFAQQGGLDVAKLFDSQQADVFHGFADRGSIVGESFQHHVSDFEVINVRSQRGGEDTAVLHGTSTDQRASWPSLPRSFGICFPPKGKPNESQGGLRSEWSAHDEVYRQAGDLLLDSIGIATEDLFPRHQYGDRMIAVIGFLDVDYLVHTPKSSL